MPRVLQPRTGTKPGKRIGLPACGRDTAFSGLSRKMQRGVAPEVMQIASAFFAQAEHG
jgi:hypothetical protein